MPHTLTVLTITAALAGGIGWVLFNAYMWEDTAIKTYWGVVGMMSTTLGIPLLSWAVAADMGWI